MSSKACSQDLFMFVSDFLMDFLSRKKTVAKRSRTLINDLEKFSKEHVEFKGFYAAVLRASTVNMKAKEVREMKLLSFDNSLPKFVTHKNYFTIRLSRHTLLVLYRCLLTHL